MRILIILISLVLLYGLLCLLVFFAQGRMVYFPARKLLATPAESGIPYQDVFLSTEDGVRIHAWRVPAERSRAWVLFFHGNAGNLSHRIDTLIMLRDLGLSTLAVDYRGYGLSEGRPDEQGTYADASAAWRHLVEDRGVDPENILIFGRSLGAAVAIELAGRVNPGGLVAESAFSSALDMGREAYPWLPVSWLLRIRYDNVSRVGSIAAPKLIVHSRTDEVIPHAMGRRLFEAAAEPKTWLEIQGGHNEGWMISRSVYEAAWRDFLTRAGF